jgi:hypothetical protein
MSSRGLKTKTTKDGQVHVTGKSARVMTLDELVKQAKIDLNEWEVVEFVVNKWEMGAIKRHKTKDDEVITEPLWQVKARFRKRPITEKQWQSLLKEIKDTRPIVVKAKKPKYSSSKLMLEMAPVDLHMGKVSSLIEAGNVFNMDVAEKLYKDAIADLAGKAEKHGFSKTTLLLGNDVMHINGIKPHTRSDKNIMDVDGRYFDIFRRTRSLMVWGIEYLTQFSPVDVVVIRGNHDFQSSWHLGEVIAAQYDGHKFVTIDNSPRPRKYRQWGVTLLGFTHGSEERPRDLPSIMAKEAPRQMVADTRYQEWHIGHLHKKVITNYVEMDSFEGTRVRILPTLTGHDSWHHEQGYMDRRASEAYLWHADHGYFGHYSYNVNFT